MPKQRLTRTDVQQIRAWCHGTGTQLSASQQAKRLASGVPEWPNRNKVSREAIYDVCRGVSWVERPQKTDLTQAACLTAFEVRARQGNQFYQKVLKRLRGMQHDYTYTE